MIITCLCYATADQNKMWSRALSRGCSVIGRLLYSTGPFITNSLQIRQRSLLFVMLSPPPSLLEQDSQKVKHKLLPLIGPFPSQLHSWAALGASIWEGSAVCFTKPCSRLSHWQEHPRLLSASANHCSLLSCVPGNQKLAIQRIFGSGGSCLLRSGPR